MSKGVSDGSVVPASARDRVRGLAVPVAVTLGRLGLTPNALTVLGFVGTCAAALAAALQFWVVAGVLVLAFGIFDLFDGALARASGRTSAFGAFLDSTLDRTGENLVLAGVAFGAGAAGYPALAGLAALALAFSSVVTYARAKAEVVGIRGDVGVAPRPERLVILAVGLVLAGLSWSEGRTLTASFSNGNALLAIALALIAGLSAITVGQRILAARRQLDTTQRIPRSE